MKLLEIKNFLRNRPGYLKKSGSSLSRILLSQGYVASKKACAVAIKDIKNELKSNITSSKSTCSKDCTITSCTCERPLKVLIYDIETSYNIVSTWRAGFKINIPHYAVIKERAIICVSYKWAGEDQVYNLTWNKNQDDKFLLEQFIEVMNEADLLVAHNGDRFDLKWIKTRALFHRLPMLIDYPQFDTLKVAKKKFYFNSNKLDYISQFLGAEGKIPTDYQLWDRVIQDKCPKALQEMLDYCDEDVRQLEKVYDILINWEKPKTHLGVLQGKDKLTSPITGSTNIERVKTVATNRGTIKHIMKDLDTDRLFEMSNSNYLKYIKNNE